MKLLSSRLRIGGLIAVAIMGITAAALPLSVSWVNDARQERDAVDQRLGSLKDVLELLVDAETGERATSSPGARRSCSRTTWPSRPCRRNSSCCSSAMPTCPRKHASWSTN